MHLQLITEMNFENVHVEQLDEAEDSPEFGKKCYYISGIFLQANIKNKNGRIYPVEILERECSRYNRDFIQQNRGLGELGHPEGPAINLERASHKFLDLHRDGNNFVGRARILESLPNGKIAAGLLSEGVKLGVSSRGMGSVNKFGGESRVGEDYFLATPGDIVHDPSAPSAFVNGILEGKEWVWDNGILQECVIAGYKNELDNTNMNHLEESRIKVFDDFMKRISGKK